MEEQLKDSLPENAFRELKEGEEYKPVMSPDKNYREVTPWSVTWGILMAILFSAAAAYLGLKVGQVFEAAIPIAIIAVGLSKATKRNNALGENVIIQSIGACSGNVVAGAIFTLPALYMLDLDASFMQIFLSSLIGGILGILFLMMNITVNRHMHARANRKPFHTLRAFSFMIALLTSAAVPGLLSLFLLRHFLATCL